MATHGSSFPGTSGSLSQEATEGCASLISRRKLKVTLLGSEWGSTKGGLSTINRELAIQLAKNDNVEVSMYLPWYSEEDKRAAAGFSVCLLKAKKKPGFEPIDWLATIPRHHCMDVVIGHGIHLGRQVQVIKELHPDCKWIQVVHTDPEELGMFKNYTDPTVKGAKKHQVEVELCQLADQVVAVGPKLTEAFACYLRSCGKDQDVINLTPGIFTEFANINQAAQGRGTFRVLVFGRCDSEDFQVKGYDIAARAVAGLKGKECSFKLVFVGAPNGEEEKVKERFLKEGISPNQLIVRSAKEREELAGEFCQADLVIMPSRTEGFGLAALEALSAGLPVLVSRNSGIGKALKKVPFGSTCVVNSEKPEIWAKAIRRVCSKKRKLRLKEAIFLRQIYAETYQWEGQCSTLVEKMLEMIEETSAVPDQAVAAVNWAEQGPSSVSGAVLHPGPTTIQQHIVGDVLTSSSKNEIQGKTPSHPIVTTTERRQGQNAGIPERVEHATLDQDYSFLRSGHLESAIGAQAMTQDTENRGKRPLHSFETTTPKRQRQNTDIPERVDHGTSDQGALLLKSNSLASAVGSRSRVKENHGKRPLHPLENATPKRQRQNTDFAETNIDISKVVELLKREYNRRAEFSPLQWSKGMKLQLTEVYTKLRVVSRRKAGSSEIDVDDIFGSSEEDNGQLLLVEGSTGIGKTTFCLKLAHDWANDAMPRNFPVFKLVFLLKCRDMKGDMLEDIVEGIFEQLLPKDLKENTKGLVNLLENLDNRNQILIILDGLDELPGNSGDRVDNVLGRKKLSSCYVLATTHQEKGIDIREQFKFYRCLAIEGFSEDNAFEYIRKHFKNGGPEDSSKGERLIKLVKRNPLLRKLKNNPLNLLLLCVVYKDHEGRLPSSSTDLYQTIVRCLLKRYCAEEGLKASNKDEDLDKQFEITVLALGELAWKCLLNGRLSFFEDELEELERSNEKIVARRLGLVYKEESLKRLKPRHAYSFLHKTFQEYFAALYIAHKLRGREFHTLEPVQFPDHAAKKFRQVFLFVCGILREEGNIFFEYIGNTLQKRWDWLKCESTTASFFIKSWQETGSAERMAKSLCSFLPFPRVLRVQTSIRHRPLLRVLKACAGFSGVQTPAEVRVKLGSDIAFEDIKRLSELPNVKSVIQPLGNDRTAYEVVAKSVDQKFLKLLSFSK